MTFNFKGAKLYDAGIPQASMPMRMQNDTIVQKQYFDVNYVMIQKGSWWFDHN